MLNAKIIETNVSNEGNITLDEEILKKADIHSNEEIKILVTSDCIMIMSKVNFGKTMLK